MLRNSNYIKDNILIADEKNTTLKYCKASTGVDLSVKTFYTLESAGVLLKNKTIVGEYKEVEKQSNDKFSSGWFLPRGEYICALNEGCKFGTHDVGYIVLRSSLNRNCVNLTSAIWDPCFTTKNANNEIENMSVRLSVLTDKGIFIEENARVGQLLVFEIEDGATEYSGQYQSRGLK